MLEEIGMQECPMPVMFGKDVSQLLEAYRTMQAPYREALLRQAIVYAEYYPAPIGKDEE